MPNIHISYLAIAIAVIAHFIFGFLWYTPLFGKIWARELGYSADMKAKTSDLLKGMFFMLIGNFFMAWVLAHNIAAWDPASWDRENTMMSPAGAALSAAIFTWLGFFLPVDLSAVAWEKKSWTFFFINTGYHLASLLLVAFILVYVK